MIVPLHEVEPRPRRVAIGEFDGVHRGHREVIRGSDAVLTFDPHPRAVISPDGAPKLLTTLERKAELIAELGVDEVIVITFDEEFSTLSDLDFIEQILIGRLGATQVTVGENFRFGAGAHGDTTLLESRPEFDTRVVALVEADSEIVSSSHIRGLLAAGEVEIASHFLGRPYELRGVVAHGDKRGRELGFATANLVPDDAYACPGHGVYACRANGVPAAVNVGVRPMFETGRGLLVEAHLIDWSGDLYGEELRVEFLERLRGERRFPSVDALIEEMGRDVEKAREIARSVPQP